MILGPAAFAGCGKQRGTPQFEGLNAVFLHEFLHMAGDNGAPDHNNSMNYPDSTHHLPDPTDRPYGCEAACFNYGQGNPAACK